MTRAALLILALAFTPWASASGPTEFDIHAELYIDGQLVSAPRLLALTGETAEISQMSDASPNKLDLKIIAKDDSQKIQDGVSLKLDLYYRKGHRIVETTQQLLVRPGTPLSVDLGRKSANTQLKVSVARL